MKAYMYVSKCQFDCKVSLPICYDTVQ